MLALAWSQQQSQGLACPQGCLGLRRWQVTTHQPITSQRHTCLPREPAGKSKSQNSFPVSKGAVPGTDVYLPAETGSLGIKSCTSLHRPTVLHPCWSWLTAVSAPLDQC